MVADALSRRQEAPATEWVLNLEVCQVLWSLWGTPSIDVFATSFNNRLQRYFSPVPDPRAVGIDAFLQDWSHQFLYMFPPFKLLNRVLAKIRGSLNCQVILIAPLWPQQAWYPDLLELLTDIPRRLPRWGNLLRQSLDQRECHHVGIFHLHAWRLSSVYWENMVFRETLLPVSLNVSGPHPLNYTNQNGKYSQIGVSRKGSIPSLPLF